MATSLSLQQQQKLQAKLSPAQIQVMRLLELPSCELQARINEELQDNPALEEGHEEVKDEYQDTEPQEEEFENPLQNEDFNYDDYVQDDDYSDNAPVQTTRGENTPQEDIPFSVGTSFSEYLKSQIYLTKMDKADRHIAKFVVGNIDEDGYLRRTPEELVDDMAFREGETVADEKMADIVAQVKQFDPPGVAAYDLQECLLIQLRQKEQTPSVLLATRILQQYFDDFSRHHYSRILQRANITEDDLKAATTEIVHLNPRPGSAWLGTVYDRNQTVVIPDFVVELVDGELLVSLNQGDVPALRVAPEYNDMMTTYSDKSQRQTPQAREAARFVKGKVEAANWFIDALRQRNETLMHTMGAIVNYQREFFLQGDNVYLRPMVLKDIADSTGYDVSTISRVCSNKFVQTEFGVYPLKFFFSEGMTNNEGEEISTREVKQKLREIVDAEDKTMPITDDELVETLRKNGYSIARRTVAKYREQLGIPVARLRKQIQ